MEIYQRHIKSNENSPIIGSNKSQQHHRTKALIQNIAFNSLSQNPNKFYTITLDEKKTKEAEATKLIEKSMDSVDQKRLIIEDLEGYTDEKKDFMNFKFGKKYYTSKLKNPLFSNTNAKCSFSNERNIDCNGKLTSNEEKTISEQKSIYSNNFENCLASKKNGNKKNLEKISRSEEISLGAERKVSNNKLFKYLEKIKQSNCNFNFDALKNKISSKTQVLENLSKSVNFQKILNHKFNSNSILECNSKNKLNYDLECKTIALGADFQQMTKKIKYLEKEISLIIEKNMKEKSESDIKYNLLDCRIHNIEDILNKLLEKLSQIN